MKVYLVGGAVRDKRLGLAVQDRDYVVVGATPEEMVAQGFRPVGADFPVFLHPETREEYALARTERKSGRGYKGFTVYCAPDVTLEDDLRRRDLTINAMAEDERGTLIDPFGGARDLEAGVLRHVSEAFTEDPLRVLRVARFAARFSGGTETLNETSLSQGPRLHPGVEALNETSLSQGPRLHPGVEALNETSLSQGPRLHPGVEARAARRGGRVSGFVGRGFRVADETMALMRGMAASGELDHLVPERVWQEFERALGETRPARFFEVLRECGALAVLFPELDALFGVPQPAEHHPEIDTGVHTLLVLDAATRLSGDARVRFAALLHDLDKGTTPRGEWPQHIGHEQRGAELVKGFCLRWRVPNEYRDLAVLVARYHFHCHRIAELRPGTVLETLEALDAFRRPERVELFALACEADYRGRPGREERPYPQAELLARAFAAAQGVDTAALAANGGAKGAEIGERIRQARAAAIKQVLSSPVQPFGCPDLENTP
jgi:tRNA nucleotidyltransferase (CCA-adding enzyme)